MPIIWIAILLIWMYFTKQKHRKKKLLQITIIVFLLFSNQMLINEFALQWEIRPRPIETLDKYDIGVLLTGVTAHNPHEQDLIYFNKGADRVYHTFKLYQQGKIEKILISGGSGRLVNNKNIKEAQELAVALRDWGVKDQDIIIEDSSRNTHENAEYSALILKKQYAESKLVLITSAFHMRRALGCFEKVGLECDAFSTDFYATEKKWTPDYWLFPSVPAFGKWHLFLHECAGYTMYKLTGYL